MTPESPQYKVTIAGNAFCIDQTTGLKGVKPYEVEFLLDKEIVDELGPISPFCKFWAPENMPQIVPGYQGLETHQLISCKPLSGAPISDIRLMNIFDMERYIGERRLAIEIELFRDDPERLRQAITDCEQDPAAFAKTQAKQMALYGKHIALKNKMKSLNAPVTPRKAEKAVHRIVEAAQSTEPEPVPASSKKARSQGNSDQLSKQLGI